MAFSVHRGELAISKESGPKEPGFGLPPEGASMLFPLLRESAGVMEHCKISNSKHQIPNNFQIPRFSDQNLFGILKLGTHPQGGESKRSEDNFGHCDLFVICYLEFLVTRQSAIYNLLSLTSDCLLPPFPSTAATCTRLFDPMPFHQQQETVCRLDRR